MSEVLQLLINGIGIGGIIGLSSLGLAVTYKVVGFVNFAHTEFMTLAAYLAIFFHALTNSFVLGSLLSVLSISLMALILEKTVWRPSRNLSSGDSVQMLILAVAVGTFMRGLIIFIWGNRPKGFDIPIRPDEVFFGINFSLLQVTAVAVAIISSIVVYAIFQYTEVGLKMRAVSDDKQLAAISGINVDKVINYTWIISASIAALSGIIYGMMGLVAPYLSFNLFLPMFAALLVVGMRDPAKAALGGFFVGIVQEMSVIVIPPEFKGGISLVIIVILLVWRERTHA
jgi:neutral amino acid transport system permease protein